MGGVVAMVMVHNTPVLPPPPLQISKMAAAELTGDVAAPWI